MEFTNAFSLPISDLDPLFNPFHIQSFVNFNKRQKKIYCFVVDKGGVKLRGCSWIAGTCILFKSFFSIAVVGCLLYDSIVNVRTL